MSGTLGQRFFAVRRTSLAFVAAASLLVGCGRAPVGKTLDADEVVPVPSTRAAVNVAPSDAPAPQRLTTADAASDVRATDSMAEREEGWTAFLGSRADSRSLETGLRLTWTDAGPPILWRRPLGTGYSTPVAMAGRLYLQHREGDVELLEAMDGATGETVWRSSCATGYVCPYPYSSGPYATPAVMDGRVMALTAEGRFRGLNLVDGSIDWERNLAEEHPPRPWGFGMGSSPRGEGDRVIVQIGAADSRASVVALDHRTGRTLWTAGDDAPSYSTPVFGGPPDARRLFVLTQSRLNCLRVDDGSTVWTYEFGIVGTPERVTSSSPVVIGNRIVITSGPGPGTVCLEWSGDDAPRVVWKSRRQLDSQFTNVIHDRDRLFGSTPLQSASFVCIDATTGRRIWSHDGEFGRANSILVEGRLIALGEMGRLASIPAASTEPSDVCVTARPVLQSPCYSQPVLHRGLLYLRNEKELVCCDLRRQD